MGEQRFWTKVEKTGACWNWIGGKTGTGYGAYHLGGGKQIRAHRYSYQLKYGEITYGLHLDHLCRNRSCVNPDHLEPVTIGENVLRGIGPMAINARRKQCINGHPFDDVNTLISKDGKRRCRNCNRERMRRFRARK